MHPLAQGMLFSMQQLFAYKSVDLSTCTEQLDVKRELVTTLFGCVSSKLWKLASFSR